MPTKLKTKKPVALIILDGWGLARWKKGNAVRQGKTPTMDYLWKNYPHTKLEASGEAVGLPSSQQGNSEAGHMNIGAGRVIKQDVAVINDAITDGSFFKNPAFISAIKHSKTHKSDLHLVGMICNYQSPHSYPDHLYALIRLLRKEGVKKFYLHLFTDGRDSTKYESKGLMKNFLSFLKPGEEVATVMGRFYGMDRKKAWDRTQAAYEAMTGIKSKFYDTDPLCAIDDAYKRLESDEFIQPTIICKRGKKPICSIKDNDSVIFFNLRSDRARQLAKALVQKDFAKKNPNTFNRKKQLKDLFFVAMTDFGPDLDGVVTAYPGVDVDMTLPFALNKHKQLYIAETEKFAHITYFLNGGHAKTTKYEKRIHIPSKKVLNYVSTPQMSAEEIAKKVIQEIKKNTYDFIAINFANADMIGHTGYLKAGIEAVEFVDKKLKQILNELDKKNGIAIITADHGNVEEMIDLETNELLTDHTHNPVPFIIYSKDNKIKNIKLKNKGILANISPTVLEIMGIKKPKDMTEESLIK